MKKRTALVFLLALITTLCLPVSSMAAPGIASIGGLGVNTYVGYCSYGDRAGGVYVEKVAGRLPMHITRSYIYKDQNAYPSRFYNASKVDLFIYSGHGKLRGDYSTAHFANPAHTDNNNSTVMSCEASSGSTRFTHAYVNMYTCNFLNNDTTNRDQNMRKMMSTGNRIMTGFGTQMYLDSREGNMFGYRMVDYVETIYNAFFNSAVNYQPQNSTSVRARAVVHNSCINDTFYAGYSGSVTSYISAPSNYTSYSLLIP